MGASVAAALVKLGKTVVVLDAGKRGHDAGSSHGHARVMRTLSSEARIFPETAEASLKMMQRMETKACQIVRKMPAVFIMKTDSRGYRDLRGSGVEELTAVRVRKQYGVHMASDEVGLVDNGAAVFDPDMVLKRFYEVIGNAGEPVRFNCQVVKWRHDADSVTVTTGNDASLHAKQLVMATGGWTPELVRLGDLDPDVAHSLGDSMSLLRVPVYFFRYPADMPDVIPITLLSNGEIDMYAMPEYRPGGRKLLKVGFHRGDRIEHPSSVDPTGEDEKRHAKRYMEDRLSRKLGPCNATVCLYAKTKSDLPLVGRVPKTKNVFVSTYGGGNCAKHAPALGDALSYLMQSPHDLSEFSPLLALDRQ